MRRLQHAVVLVLMLVSSALAQTDEAKFNHAQADRLNKFAKTALKKGFPRQAKLIWLQVLKLYDADDADAHQALGHVKVGASWTPDPSFVYPTEDTGTGKDGISLYKAYEKLKDKLAGEHRQQAKAWAKADRAVKARHHYQMVLRWVKDDKEAQTALQHREVGGVTGTDLEKTLYDRSKSIEKAVAEQALVDYPVEQVEMEVPVLDHAQVEYVSVKSEHFVLHGDADERAHLEQALVWAERALRVVQTAFPWRAEVRAEWAFFVAKDTYKQILRAHRVPNLEWKLENTSTSAVGNLVVGTTPGIQVLYDAAVRNVAKVYAGFITPGFTEGIGHTFVGMIFNNNRLFAVDLLKQQQTTASEEDLEYTSPNFDIWKSLVLEMAWKQTGGVPALDLPFCDAATFTNEQRIKAWSFCDYVMRRDPELLRHLDRLGAQAHRAGTKRPRELADTFAAEADVTIEQLDKEWEDFWTEATPVLQAIRNNTPPLAAISSHVEKWLAAFNEARATHRATPVTWSSNLSTRCHDHAVYLASNKDQRGPAAEHRQAVDLGGSHLGSMFAQTAIVEVSATPGRAKKMFAGWMEIPGYRDALVHDFLRSVGIYSDGGILVMNVVAGLGAAKSKRSGYLCHPSTDAKGIPAEVDVAAIGPELEALLEQHGHGGAKTVGYPLTLHFGQSVQGDRQTYRCLAKSDRGETIEGAILLDDGVIRRSTAPGMVTFYPFEPLPRGKIEATWSWQLDGELKSLTTRFQTR